MRLLKAKLSNLWFIDPKSSYFFFHFFFISLIQRAETWKNDYICNVELMSVLNENTQG